MCALPSPEDTMPSIRIDRPSDHLFMTVCNGAKQHVEQPCGMPWQEIYLGWKKVCTPRRTIASVATTNSRKRKYSRCTMDGKPTIMLSANNYLNLTTHPKVVEASIAATRKYGAGSGSVRAIAGTMDIHLEAETKLPNSKELNLR